MGFTLMHEHVRVGWGPMYQQYPELFDHPHQLSRAVEKLSAARAAGVKTIVDLTPIDLGRDASFIREAAMMSGLQVIVATGFYYAVPFSYIIRPDSDMVALFVRDITEGISTTGVRAGVIKCATEPAMHEHNEKVLRCSAIAAMETGVPICTHTYPANRTGLDQQRVFKEAGMDMSRTVIGHSDDTQDLSYLEEIIQNGSYCGMDRMGLPFPNTSEQRADMVASLVEKGYADRITLSHDSCCNMDWVPEGQLEQLAPDWKITHIHERIIPLLKERGVSDAAIEQMTVKNPRAIFEKGAK